MGVLDPKARITHIFTFGKLVSAQGCGDAADSAHWVAGAVHLNVTFLHAHVGGGGANGIHLSTLPPPTMAGVVPLQHQFLTVANDNSIALWALEDEDEDGRFFLSCQKRYMLSTDA